MLTDLSKSSVQYFSASGEILLTSLRVMPSRVRPGGLHREGLRRPRLIARRVEARHRALLDAEERLAGQAVEHEQQALLRHLRDGGNLLSVLRRLDQRRRRADVPVVDVVVRRSGSATCACRSRPAARAASWRRGSRRAGCCRSSDPSRCRAATKTRSFTGSTSSAPRRRGRGDPASR